MLDVSWTSPGVGFVTEAGGRDLPFDLADDRYRLNVIGASDDRPTRFGNAR